jgi:hypothetical protein
MTNVNCRALYPGTSGAQGGCGTYMPATYANGSTYFYDNWCPCANTGEVVGAGPVSAIGAVPAVSGSQCYSTASASLPSSSSQAGSCTTSILTAFATSGTTSGTTSGITSASAAFASLPALALLALPALLLFPS